MPDTNENANVNGPAPAPPTEKKIKVKSPWLHTLKGDEEGDEPEFGYPTIGNEPVELTQEQYNTAKAAARSMGFKLREVKN